MVWLLRRRGLRQHKHTINTVLTRAPIPPLHHPIMKPRPRFPIALLTFFAAVLLTVFLPVPAYAQAYAGKPKLIVVVVIDQFRGDYLYRDRDEFKGRGFRLFM
ncbi:MAG: hypothetical protein ABSG60_05325, partial [Terracidiphilus sp.]